MKRTQILNLGKHFSIIDSPVPFYLVDNYGFRAYRPAGAWQFDNWKLLPEKFHRNYPVFTLSIEWDSGENDSIFPEFTDTDLDLGDGIAGVSGQPVMISNPVTVMSVEQPVTVKEVENPVKLLENSLVDNFKHGMLNVIKKGNENPGFRCYVKTGYISMRSDSDSSIYSLTDCYLAKDIVAGGRIMDTSGKFFVNVFIGPAYKNVSFLGIFKELV